jgi:hypothetical protein
VIDQQTLGDDMTNKGPIAMNPILILGEDVSGNIVCAIAELPDEPCVVGLMLADMVRHVANVYCGEEESVEKGLVVMKIASMFNAEMSKPTAGTHVVTKSGRMVKTPMMADMNPDEQGE